MNAMNEKTNARQSEAVEPVSYWSPWLAIFFLAWCYFYLAFAPHPVDLLAQNFPYVLVGFAGAVIGNLTALGGGLIFIPVLIFIYHVPPVLALKTSILTQAFGMSSGALMWSKFSEMRWNVVLWAVPGMLLGSTVSSLIFAPNAFLVKGLFGPVSICLGTLLLLSLRSRAPTIPIWSHRTKLAVVAASTFGGLITGWVAIGEGELVGAMLMLFFGFSARTAIPIGVCLLALNSIYLASIHSIVLGGVPWNIVAFTVLGAVFGARLAPFCARLAKPVALKATFAIVAILDGSLFLLQYLLWSHS